MNVTDLAYRQPLILEYIRTDIVSEQMPTQSCFDSNSSVHYPETKI